MEFSEAAILLIGDEILQGRVSDRNIPTVARELAWRGLPVCSIAVAADSEGSIASCLASLRSRGRLIVTTGGLGPTEDDITPSSIAASLGIELAEDAGAREMIRSRYLDRGLECPESALRQALVPRGATAVRNPVGVAPGIVLEIPGSCECIVMLPGVPREVEGLVSPCLDAAGAAGPGIDEARTLGIWGIPENRLMDLIKGEGLDMGSSLAFLPRPGQVELTIKGADPSTAFDAIRTRLAASVYSLRRGETIEQVLGMALQSSGVRLAVAESCTGGLLGGRLTSVPGASAWFDGGVISYSDSVKQSLLGVKPSTLESFGAVSRSVAEEMARSAALLTGAGAALALTGIAGPDGGTDSKPVGMVWIAALLGDRLVSREFRFGGTRATVREAACTCAQGMLLELLREGGG